MDYQVVTVTDEELPAGTDWALVRSAGTYYLFVKDGKLTCALLRETWDGFMRSSWVMPMPVAV